MTTTERVAVEAIRYEELEGRDVRTVEGMAQGGVEVYLLGDWPARLGIVLMLDRLGALMVLTTSLLAIPCLLYACAGWDKRALHFHALFQIQLAGLNGAFLTGDAFNLFVFFEVLLIASYGLMLHGQGPARLQAGVQYVVINLVGSTLFLVAVGILYGVTGTLNMADLSLRIAAAPPGDQGLIAAAQKVEHYEIATYGSLATYAKLLGLLAGLWSEKFDQIAAVTNFVITPLSFLSGTFYSTDVLPEPFRIVIDVTRRPIRSTW